MFEFQTNRWRHWVFGGILHTKRLTGLLIVEFVTGEYETNGRPADMTGTIAGELAVQIIDADQQETA